MNSAIIVAGGSGQRFGSKTPKQFLKIGGKEILEYSVQTFNNHPEIDEVIIVTHSDWVNHVRDKYTECIITTGGDTRQKSVTNGLKICNEKYKFVLIHDAARPFVTSKIIQDCIDQLKEFQVVVPVLNPPDSLIKFENNSTTILDRTQIKIIQTPQCFHVDIINKSLFDHFSATDDFGLVLQAYPDISYTLIDGDENNFKITHQSDLERAKFIINSRNANN